MKVLVAKPEEVHTWDHMEEREGGRVEEAQWEVERKEGRWRGRRRWRERGRRAFWKLSSDLYMHTVVHRAFPK